MVVEQQNPDQKVKDEKKKKILRCAETKTLRLSSLSDAPSNKRTREKKKKKMQGLYCML